MASLEATIRQAIQQLVARGPSETSLTDLVFYQAGQRIGRALEVNSLAEIIGRIEELGMGHLEMVSQDAQHIILDWYDCLTCSHLPPVGKPLCHLEAGLLSGAISRISSLEYSVEETRCWGTGYNYCRMEAKPSLLGAKVTQEEVALAFDPSNESFWVNLVFEAVQAVKLSRKSLYPLPTADLPLTWFDPLGLGEALFDRLPVGLYIVDSAGQITRMNASARQVFSLDASAVLRQPVKAILSESRWLEVLASGLPEIWPSHKGSSKEAALPKAAPDKESANHLVIEMPLLSEGKTIGVLGQILPIDSPVVRLLLDRLRELQEEIDRYQQKLKGITQEPQVFGDLVSYSAPMQKVLQQARRVALTDATVLLQGASGVGKEVLAKTIHRESHRAQGPFVKVDCASLPQELLESELFGYEEGAFTGARKGGKKGKLELAQGGTLFLDEIADLPPAVQAKLLRVLQDREFERLGGTKTVKIDVRIIAATNKDLAQEVALGRFREDLFFRLDVFTLRIPSLVERRADIPSLVESFLSRLVQQYGRPVRLAPEVLTILEEYHWPGNVRELGNVLERAYILAEDGRIAPEHLPERLLSHYSGVKETTPANLKTSLNQTEREAILAALLQAGGNKAQAARRLGITRQTLYEKMKKLKISPVKPT